VTRILFRSIFTILSILVFSFTTKQKSETQIKEQSEYDVAAIIGSIRDHILIGNSSTEVSINYIIVSGHLYLC